MKLFIVLTILTCLLCSGKMKTVDVHDAWDSYPSADSDGEKVDIKFPNKKALNKFNKSDVSNIISEKDTYLSKQAIIILGKRNDYLKFIDVGIMYAQNSRYIFHLVKIQQVYALRPPMVKP